jgi:ubiquinone/menaquinone biosynthesis C-methylase UbiE
LVDSDGDKTLVGSDRDWRSYDAIAHRYDHVWRDRFEPVGRALWELLRPDADAVVLDIGTGTGALPLTLREVGAPERRTIGCDRSIPMLRQARSRVPDLCVVAADAMRLPFCADVFDVATASFVLSHVRDYRHALDEAHRVLKRGGALAVSNWAPPSDPYSVAWTDALAQAVSMEALDRAVTEITPYEGHFSEEGRLEGALDAAGFTGIRSRVVDIALGVTVQEYLIDRALSARGRLAQHLLGPERWSEVSATMDELFRRRFGAGFT